MSGPLPPYGQPPADEQPPAVPERSLWPDPTADARADPFPPAPPTRSFPPAGSGYPSGQFQPPMPPPIPPDRPAQPPSVTYQPPAVSYQVPAPVVVQRVRAAASGPVSGPVAVVRATSVA